MSAKNNDAYLDEAIFEILLKNPNFHPASVFLLTYSFRAARGVSLRNNLIKIRYLSDLWLKYLDNQDTQ